MLTAAPGDGSYYLAPFKAAATTSMACGSRCRPRKDALCCEGGPVLAHSLDVSSIQEHGANHCKLDSSATPIPPVPHREGNRAIDGLRPQARTLRPPRRDHDLSRYRHGLRASEVCDLQWHQIELSEGRLHVRRVKNGMPSVHPLTGKELRALRRLQGEQEPGRYVFMSERGAPQ